MSRTATNKPLQELCIARDGSAWSTSFRTMNAPKKKVTLILLALMMGMLPFLLAFSPSAGRSEGRRRIREERLSKAPLTQVQFLPMMQGSWITHATLPAPIAMSGNPPIDFEAVSHDLRDQGLYLAHSKIGFHVGTNIPFHFYRQLLSKLMVLLSSFSQRD